MSRGFKKSMQLVPHYFLGHRHTERGHTERGHTERGHTERGHLGRRGFLAAGAVAGLGMSLGDFLAIHFTQAASNQYTTPPQIAKSVIQIFLEGGLSAQESWDPNRRRPSNTAES